MLLKRVFATKLIESRYNGILCHHYPKGDLKSNLRLLDTVFTLPTYTFPDGGLFTSLMIHWQFYLAYTLNVPVGTECGCGVQSCRLLADGASINTWHSIYLTK
jgi:hypothetical protein